MSGKNKQTSSVKKGGGGIGLMSFIIISILMLIALKQIYLVFFIGILPTLAAWMTDRTNKKYYLKIVGGFNLAGVLPSVMEMWNMKGSSFSDFQNFFSPYTLLVMYGTASIGWGLILFLQSILF